MSGLGVVGATLNTITFVFDVADCVKQVIPKDEELLRPSGDDVGGSAAENPSASGVGTRGYPYRPLLSENQIRLLLLEPLAPGPTQDSQPICATLHHVEFDSESLSTRPYKALSYEWEVRKYQFGKDYYYPFLMIDEYEESIRKEPKNVNPAILLDGHTVHIGKNLYHALKSIRHLENGTGDKSSLWLWVDTLCINQSDIQERGHQVRLMKRIYETAEMVLMWLGRGNTLTRMGMVAMNMEPDDFEKLVAREGLIWGELEGIRRICDMGYWRRVWILQEVVLARDYLVICNQDFISMEKFERALRVLCQHALNWRGFLRGLINRLPKTPAQEIITWRNTKGTTSPLIEWLKICVRCGFESTDQRDYVYALLGISDDCKGKIEPNYSRSAEEVYSSAIALIEDKAKGYNAIFCTNLAEFMGLDKWEATREV
ncbi:heterokaryon incompatibility protein-domain-containing protein [Neurospora tetraspora]|uniref:Heterokaryon incompatibility protein-domain-containing protein n=1 Tax=Neurospora tetraspora TaxID=94610 RepID=A0AAE0MT73_9PEZI|nr:heterokaryon incompatibility protein-domain-containing protein [Neurospora tetraspora]